MIVDGKKLAEDIKALLKDEVFKIGKKIRLAVVRVGSDAVTEKFLEQKKKFAKDIGVDVRVYELPDDISTNALRKKLAEIVHIKENTGVIVQLPLPKHIKTQYILDGITPEKDPDMLSSKSIGLFSTGRAKILPPVAGAVDFIFRAYGIDLPAGKARLKAKNAVVIGAGRLVGKPIAAWLLNEGAAVTIIDENTLDTKPYTINADIIISGAGVPGLVKPDMVKDGVIAIDCGTSESNGKLAGDLDQKISEKASLFSPIPGGVGPLTVAMLFKNLVELSRK